MKISSTTEIDRLVTTLRGYGLQGVIANEVIAAGTVHLVEIDVPRVMNGAADLHITVDRRLGSATWLLIDRHASVTTNRDVRHTIDKVFMGGATTMSYVIGSESGRIYVGCSGASTLSECETIDELLVLLPLIIANARANHVSAHRSPWITEAGIDLLAALSLASIEEDRPRSSRTTTHLLCQGSDPSDSRLALPAAG